MKLLFLAALLAAPVSVLADIPSDPAAPVPPLEYRSVFEGLPQGVEEEAVDWKKANAEVAQFPRGHVDLLKWEEANGASAPAAAPSAPPSARPAPAAAPARPAASNAKGTVDPNTILAPIAGTVQKVFVQAGTHVEEKTPVILLDAMKMDTYIHAPRTGDVAEVCVAPGDTVQVGTVLLRYRAEG